MRVGSTVMGVLLGAVLGASMACSENGNPRAIIETDKGTMVLELYQDQAPKTDNAWCSQQLQSMTAELDWMQARRDVQRFVKPHELPSLELWTREFFLQQCAKLSELESPD